MSRLQFWSLVAALAIGGLAPLTQASTPAPTALQTSAPVWTDDQLTRAFEAADPRKQSGLVDYMRLDLGYSETFQRSLLNYVWGIPDIDRGLYPLVASPHWYDPEVTAPGQTIPRKLVPAGTERNQDQRKRFGRSLPNRALTPGWSYDWASSSIVRLPTEDDPARHFANALAGFPPELDLAEAIVISLLDDGSRSAAAASFGKLYTDRNGRAYEGITLYDAWDSGNQIEMPDVDTLGLAGDLLDELAPKWVAPVPESQHPILYPLLEERFIDLQRYRSVREAIARTYLSSSPKYSGGYTPGNLESFHAFWERHASDPNAAAEAAPQPEAWTSFLSELVESLGQDAVFLAKARNRRAVLAQDEAFVRLRLIALMQDMRILPATPEEFEAGPTQGPPVPD